MAMLNNQMVIKKHGLNIEPRIMTICVLSLFTDEGNKTCTLKRPDWLFTHMQNLCDLSFRLQNPMSLHDRCS